MISENDEQWQRSLIYKTPVEFGSYLCKSPRGSDSMPADFSTFIKADVSLIQLVKLIEEGRKPKGLPFCSTSHCAVCTGKV